jgi:hypothetical protein
LAQQLGDQLLGLRVGVHVQLGQLSSQQPIGPPDRVRLAKLRLKAHEPPVSSSATGSTMIACSNAANAPWGVISGLAKLGQVGQGVDRPAAQVLSGARRLLLHWANRPRK